jgi:hypothetical protein
MMLLINSSPSLLYSSKKVKVEGILSVLCAPERIFGTHLAQNM